MEDNRRDTKADALTTTIGRFCVAVILSIAFAYIEASVVVYLRQIFYAGGFSFPLAEFGIHVNPLWRRLILTEIGREAATLVLIVSAAWLSGRSRQQRFAYFMTIFAVWDIFFYIWLKVLTDWPASIMHWDVLFLIPVVWAAPVLAPVLVSTGMLFFAVTILWLSRRGRILKVTLADRLGFLTAALAVIVSFCVAGLHITELGYASYFYWPLFGAGYLAGLAVFAKCLAKSTRGG